MPRDYAFILDKFDALHGCERCYALFDFLLRSFFYLYPFFLFLFSLAFFLFIVEAHLRLLRYPSPKRPQASL